jgi:hypothetical protein
MRTVDAEVTKVHFEKEALFTGHGSEFSQRRAFGLKTGQWRLVLTARKSAYSLVLTGDDEDSSRFMSPQHILLKPISGISFHSSLF